MKRLGSVLLASLIVVAGVLASGVWQASAGPFFVPPPTSTPGLPPPTPFGFTVPPTPLPICESEWYPSLKSPDHPCGTPVTSPDKIPTQRILPSVTPLPISRVTDFGPDLPLKCKSDVVVRRANGEYDEFLVPMGQDYSQIDSTLKQGDQVILSGPPLAVMRMGVPHPPTFTADGRVLFAPTPTSECP